jgi:sugar-specific transcriptional regulator TrmB
VQARIYLNLAKLGQATIATISKTAQLDRSEVYRGISQLQKLGLVEKIINTPSIFKSTPLRDGLAIMLERKTNEYHGTKIKTEQLIRKSKEYEGIETLHEEKTQFIIVPEREVALRRWIKATENAQKSLDYIIRWEGIINGLTERSECSKRMLDRGVKIRGIVSEPKSSEIFSRGISDYKKRGSYNVRYILTIPPAVFSIFDKKEVLLNIVTAPLPKDTPNLWSNNPCIAAVVQDYFELKWRTAERFPKKEQLHLESLCEDKSA